MSEKETFNLTASQLQKKIKELNLELSGLQLQERKGSFFTVSVSEDKEEVRPDYNLRNSYEDQFKVMKRLSAYKHVLNQFNQTTVVPGFNLTIDELLVQMPIIKDMVKRLENCKNSMGRERIENMYTRGTSTPEYRYANFSTSDAKDLYEYYNNLLIKMQLAIDNINSTNVIQFEYEEII